MTLSPHYIIPRKIIQCTMEELSSDLSSRKDIIDIFYNSFKGQQHKDYLIKSVYSITNAELIRNFQIVRSQLRVPSQPNPLGSSSFNYGFTEVPDLKQAELVAKSGVVPCKQAGSIYLGTDVHGVFLCLHGDYTSKDKPHPTSSHFIIVCHLALNVDCVQWVHPVSDKNEQPPSFPTNRKFGANVYLKGCHSAVRSLCKTQQDPAWAESFEAGLIYLWDHNGQFRPILAPRHCLPVAVIHYTYHGSPYQPLDEDTLSSHVAPTSQLCSIQLDNKNTTPVSQPMQAGKLTTKIHTETPLLHTDILPFDSVLNPSLQLDREDKLLLWKRFKEAALSASQLWTGVLYNGNSCLCPIKLRTYYPPSFSLQFSELINIELATHFDLFYKEFPNGLFTTAYPMLYDSKLACPIVIKNNSIHYAEVCPYGGAAIPILNAFISHLQEKQLVAYGHIDEFTRIYIIPTSHLTLHLKITHSSHPNILHALIYRLIQPSLSSCGVSTSPQTSDKSCIIKPIPTLITPRVQGQNNVCNGHVSSAGPYPFILQRVPFVTTRTIGTQHVPSSFNCKCQCGASTTVDVACQTSINNTKEQACQTVSIII